MNLDIAGSSDQSVPTDPRIRYVSVRGTGSYSVPAHAVRQRIITRRRGDQIIVRDLVSGAQGSGATYLDALQAFDRARRPQ